MAEQERLCWWTAWILAPIPEPSAGFEEWQEDSPLEGNRALAEVSMAEVSTVVEVFMAAEAGEGNFVQLRPTRLMIRRKNMHKTI